MGRDGCISSWFANDGRDRRAPRPSLRPGRVSSASSACASRPKLGCDSTASSRSFKSDRRRQSRIATNSGGNVGLDVTCLECDGHLHLQAEAGTVGQRLVQFMSATSTIRLSWHAGYRARLPVSCTYTPILFVDLDGSQTLEMKRAGLRPLFPFRRGTCATRSADPCRAWRPRTGPACRSQDRPRSSRRRRRPA